MRRELVMAGLVVSLAVTGCGSGSKRPSSTATAPDASAPSSAAAPADRSAYLVAANGICSDMEATLNGSADTVASLGLKEANTVLVSIVRDAVVRLRALTPPAGDEATVAALYDRFDELASRQESLYTTDVTSADELDRADAELTALVATSDADAAAFGLVACRFGPS